MAGTRDNLEHLAYGVAFVVAVTAGGVALWSNAGEDDVPTGSTDAVEAARARATAEERSTTIRFDGPPRPTPEPAAQGAHADDFVPDLPAVPDLATEPPPTRAPAAQEPRMESLAAEMRVLSRARRLLGTHPAEALGVIRQHRRQFPDGVLREEREAFAVEALLALEHADEAERRYYDFLSDFPDSEHRAHLQRAMLRPPHRVGAGGR